jgi:hypothetical protein
MYDEKGKVFISHPKSHISHQVDKKAISNRQGDCFMEGESDKNNGLSGDDIDEFCTTCHQYFDKEDECWGNYVPLTRDEEAILAQMREVKAKVAAVKKRLKEIEGKKGFEIPREKQDRGEVGHDQALWLEQNQLMATLREEWQELDLRRQEAASFRMKILGHED